MVVTVGLTVEFPFPQTTFPVEQLALKMACPPEDTVAGFAFVLVGGFGTF